MMAMTPPTLGRLTQDLGILYGGDYNPEQWTPDVWREDVRLMRSAGVNVVTVGVFSWSRYEPAPDEVDFGWMDEVLGLLAGAGIAVDLATPIASPPPWLGHRYPETLPMTRDGLRLGYGSRSHFSPASRKYRERASLITRALVERYASHPAVRMWHVGNELGQQCYGDEAAAAFRSWLQSRYGTLGELNRAWATDVWSQRYGDWSEVVPPRAAPYHHNPSQVLDFRRFSSDLLLEVFREQKAIIREFDATHPVTTNLMGFFEGADYQSWAADLDIVADDAYPDPADPYAPADSALTQALMRSLASGEPWMLMEQATSAVSWRSHNRTKSPARSRLESLQAVAHGCDAVCFFQWRQAKSGPERFHSAMLPLAGQDTRVYRGVRALGEDLTRLRPVVGARTVTSVALVWDWQSWWAASQEAMPTERLDPLETLRSWHRCLWEAGIAVDVVPPTADVSGYAALLAPALYVLEPDGAARLEEYVKAGGTLVVGPFSAVADAQGHLATGRFPALLRDLLGVSGEEWLPLPDEGVDVLWTDGRRDRVSTFAESVRSDGARVRATFAGGELDGSVAVSSHAVGGGEAWYVAAVLGPGLRRLLDDVMSRAGVQRVLDAPQGVEVVVRGDALFLLNHTAESVALPVAGVLDGVPRRASSPDPERRVVDLLTGAVVTDAPSLDDLLLPPEGVAVLVERSAALPEPADRTVDPDPTRRENPDAS